MTKTKAIDIIGAPSTFGQRKLGVDLGPTTIRYAGLISRLKQLDLDVYDKLGYHYVGWRLRNYYGLL